MLLQRELGELQNIGDADSVARAERLYHSWDKAAEVDEGRRFIDPVPAAEEAAPLDYGETDAPLEADFHWSGNRRDERFQCDSRLKTWIFPLILPP